MDTGTFATPASLPSRTHSQARSNSALSKYCFVMKGHDSWITRSCHFFSPTTAQRSTSPPCFNQSFKSSQAASRSIKFVTPSFQKHRA